MHLLNQALASVELAGTSKVQKILVTDGFKLPERYRVFLENAGWQCYENMGNPGPASSKNLAISKISDTVKYVAFQDADDITHPYRFKKCLELISTNPKLIAGTQTLIFRSIGEKGGVRGLHSFPKRRSYIVEDLPLQTPRPKMIYATMILPRGAITSYELFNESKFRGEDFDLIERLIQLGYQITNLNEKMYAYRHPLFDNFKTYGIDYRAKHDSGGKYLRYLLSSLSRLRYLRISRIEKQEWSKVFENVFIMSKTFPSPAELLGSNTNDD